MLHDQWFHLPLVRREGDEYVLPFVVEETDEIEVLAQTRRGRPQRWRVPLYRAELRVAAVEEVRIDDRSQIETFSCVDLTYDRPTRVIHLEAAEDAHVYMKVGRLDVVLSRSDERVSHAYRRSIFFGEVSGAPEPDPWSAEATPE